MLQRWFCILGALALSLALGSCGGSSSSIDTQDSSSPLTPQQWAAMSHGSPAEAETGSLPSIPLDTDAGRSTSGNASNGGDPSGGDGSGTSSFTVLGADFLDQDNCVVNGTGLDINTGDATLPPQDRQLGWALYKIGGLSGQHAISLNVECLPGGLGQKYYVGVADYSHMAWNWSDAVTIPEFQFDLSQDNSRYITNLGNLYFVVVCHGDNTAFHSQSTVVTGQGGGDKLPGAPFNLIASKGDFPDGIAVSWDAGAGSMLFELQRSSGQGPNPDGSPGGGDWQTIAQLDMPTFFDANLPPGQIFSYRARAINAAGVSGWSNIDYGYVGDDQPPGGNYSLQGTVYLYANDGSDPNGGTVTPLAGVMMKLYSFDNTYNDSAYTDASGFYYFENLPEGGYTVMPNYQGVVFTPAASDFYISEQSPNAWIDFMAQSDSGGGGGGTEMGVYGNVYASDGANPDGQASPLPGALVTITGSDATIIFEGITDDKGFYQFIQIPPGVWTIQCSADGYYFSETYTFQVGNQVPDLRFDFYGQTAP